MLEEKLDEKIKKTIQAELSKIPRHEAQTAKAADSQSPTTPKTKAKIQLANLSSEMKEREDKQNNIIIFKLTESTSTVLETRKKEDATYRLQTL